MKLNTGRYKYCIWAVKPANREDQNPKALVYVALGLKKDVKRRWFDLTHGGEFHMPILFWQNTKKLLRNISFIRYELYAHFDWKPDALKHLELLRQQHKFLLVEDLTNDRLGQPESAGVRGSSSNQGTLRPDPSPDARGEGHLDKASEEQPWIRPDSISG